MEHIPERQDALDQLVAEHFNGDPPLSSNESGPRTYNTHHTTSGNGELERRARHYIDKIEPAHEGQRNQRAFNAAGNLAAMVTDDGARLTEGQIVELMEGWNARNVPPLPGTEIQSVVRNAMRNGTPRPDKRSQQPERRARLTGADEPQEPVEPPVSFADLHKANPELYPPVIDGALRQGETGNIIAASKMGKSWLAYMILLCVITGRKLFEAFQCTPGRVLLIDNELHPSVISNRIPRVADAMGIDPSEYQDQLDVLALRGHGVSIDDLRRYIERIEAGYYRLIVADAWYRFVPPGMNENSNADVMALYNRLDNYAARTKAAWLVVHHSSKGSQGEKSVTDVGAGAGAQSRAADSHLILRPHEEEGAVVLEAAVRSFAPIEPIGLRWEFPLWERAYTLDTEAVQGRKTRGEERQDDRDAKGRQAILDALSQGPMTTRQIRAEAGGMGKQRAERLLDLLETEGRVTWQETIIRGGKGRLYEPVQPGM